MSFWTSKDIDPKRNFRFRLSNGSGNHWWWAKTVDRPSFDVSNNEYQLINHKFKYPGIVTWKPISIAVVDTGQMINQLYLELRLSGYTNPSEPTQSYGLEKDYTSTIDKMKIEQLKGDGTTAETWTLYGAFITSVSLSKLDYSSDDLSDITIEIAYDYATLA
jgi:hypothetical protein